MNKDGSQLKGWLLLFFMVLEYGNMVDSHYL